MWLRETAPIANMSDTFTNCVGSIDAPCRRTVFIRGINTKPWQINEIIIIILSYTWNFPKKIPGGACYKKKTDQQGHQVKRRGDRLGSDGWPHRLTPNSCYIAHRYEAADLTELCIHTSISDIWSFTTSTLMTETEGDSWNVGSVFNSTLTWLIAREDFRSTFIRHEIFKSFLSYIGAWFASCRSLSNSNLPAFTNAPTYFCVKTWRPASEILTASELKTQRQHNIKIDL
jgi:hypothetical protein